MERENSDSGILGLQLQPTHYLKVGTGLVVLIVAIIVAMNLMTGAKVSRQHATFLVSQSELQNIDRMQTATHRIVSSTNEIVLIQLTASPSTGTGEVSENVAELRTEPEASPDQAIAREQQMITDATAEFKSAMANIGDTKLVKQTTMDGLGEAIAALLAVNDEIKGAISAVQPDKDLIFELKEKQEDAEGELLSNISAERTRVLGEIKTQGQALEGSLSATKQYAVLAGLLAGAILLSSNLLIGKRINAMFKEISDQRHSIEKSNQDLNAAMATLRDLQDDLVKKEKFATLGNVTATVSHELRNPLAAIRNCAYIIKEGIGVAPELTSFVDRIERNVIRCDHIIADLLEYTRTRALALHRVDIGPWLQAAVSEQPLPANVKVSVTLADRPVFADIDEMRLVRAIINLVENAAHAIAATNKPGEIRISCGEKDARAVITVSDNGPGIPESLKGKIFEPLFTTKNFGAGLGLSITRNLVIQHRGALALQSSTGAGSTFTISLPISSQAEKQAAA